MSDNLRVYRAVLNALLQLHPTPPQGHYARHLKTLAMLISGIVQSQKSQLPAIARKIPVETNAESRIKKLTRWLQNEHVTLGAFYLPFAQAVLFSLPSTAPLTLAMDSSQVGRGCSTWIINVIYQNRAIPLVWFVAQKSKGHASCEEHLKLLRAVQEVIPPGRSVVFLGDGEFDGVPLLEQLREWGWGYVVRTAKNSRLEKFDVPFQFLHFHYRLMPGQTRWVDEVFFTQGGFGPVLAIATWPGQEEEPIYLISSLASALEACAYYKKRFRIETFFSDQKSRGFYLEDSHLSSPARLERLMIGTCLAYLWMVFLGVEAQQEKWQRKIHRKTRCDWSLFRLGLALLDCLLNLGLEILVFFSPPPSTSLHLC